MKSKIKYIYILSQRYSGSTLLSFLLGSHPEISTIGERRKFHTKSINPDHRSGSICSCGKQFTECAYWTQIKTNLLKRVGSEDLTTNVTEFSVYPERYKKANYLALRIMQFCFYYKVPFALWPFSKKIKTLCSTNQILVEEILKIDQKTCFLDSSKIINHALLLSLIEKFDFHIIWLSRDPRAQVVSAMKYNDWTIEEAAVRWAKEMKINQRLLQKSGIPFHSLQYEKLCRQPEKEMENLFQFIDLDPTGFTIDFRAKTQHLMGNASMRMGTDEKIVERKEWRNKLSSSDIKKIENLTVDFQQYYAPDF